MPLFTEYVPACRVASLQSNRKVDFVFSHYHAVAQSYTEDFDMAASFFLMRSSIHWVLLFVVVVGLEFPGLPNPTLEAVDSAVEATDMADDPTCAPKSTVEAKDRRVVTPLDLTDEFMECPADRTVDTSPGILVPVISK